MYERALNNPKIEIKTFRTVRSWLSDETGLSGAVLKILEMVVQKRYHAQVHSLQLDINQLLIF